MIGDFFKKKPEYKSYPYRPFDIYDTGSYIVQDYIRVARHSYSPEAVKKNHSLFMYIASVSANDTPQKSELTNKPIFPRFGDLEVNEERILKVYDFLNALSNLSQLEKERWLNEVVYPEGFLES